MNVITLRDYAKNNNISYEAVRQQIVRYKKELGDHIIKDGRQQFLDEEAVAFLDSKRQKNPVAIIQQDKDEQIEALKQDKENFLITIANQATKIAELEAWKADNAIAIAEANQNKRLLEEKTGQIEALETDRDNWKDKTDKAEQKVQKLVKDLELEKGVAEGAIKEVLELKAMSIFELIGWKLKQRKKNKPGKTENSTPGAV